LRTSTAVSPMCSQRRSRGNKPQTSEYYLVHPVGIRAHPPAN
jgi:hypothetical protein